MIVNLHFSWVTVRCKRHTLICIMFPVGKTVKDVSTERDTILTVKIVIL